MKKPVKQTSKGRTYYYAWRGGPRLKSEFGTVAFVQELERLRAEEPPTHAGTLQAIINRYQASLDFTGLAEETRKGYVRRIRKIEAAFGDMPVAALADREVRGEFLDWRDGIAATHPREADYCLTVLQAVLSWAKDRGIIGANPVERPGRRWRGTRVDVIWSDDDVAAFLKVCPPHLRLPFLIGLDTGQREKDILRLPWSAYDGKSIRLTQSKTGRRVSIPVTQQLKAALDATKRRGPIICVNSRGLPWTLDGFKSSWARWRPDGLTFNDLRGTTVTRLALAGCTDIEIAALTGHSFKSVSSILDRHYLHRDQRLAQTAVARLEEHQKGKQ